MKHVLPGRPAPSWLCAAVFGIAPALRGGAMAVLFACTGGQSGTETPTLLDGGPPARDGGPVTIFTEAAPCPCALADRNALLRATLVAIDDCRVRARVDEVLASAPELDLELETDSELDVMRVLGCGEQPDLAAGDPVLLVYAPAVDGTPAAALVATWGSEHVFGTDEEGDAIALPERERERLLEAEACNTWFGEPDAAADARMSAPAEPQCGDP